jgi:hypothetical protein
MDLRGVATPRRSIRRALEHWEYDRERVDGFDYDIGAALIKSADTSDESELIAVLSEWGVRPGLFVHPWDSGDPK